MHPALQDEVVQFQAADGQGLNLIHVQSGRPAPRGPVLLVHGAGVRANIFRAPVAVTLVDALIDQGYDVWMENWRASIDLAPNHWTLDQAALHDHPRAVTTVLERTGAGRIKAIIHCQGSTSFMMSLVAGLLPAVSAVISNAVSLHPVVPEGSRFKLDWIVPVITGATDYMNPHWGVHSEGLLSGAVTAAVGLLHHECASPVCKLVSFIYGSGHPALWLHENLDAETHDRWINGEFAWVPLSFFRQMARCVHQGHLVTVDGLPGLSGDPTAAPPATTARIAFFAGAENRCFLPESQRRTFAYFERLQPGRHSLRILPGYSHLDVFMGINAARDVFPAMLAELNATP